MLFRSWLTMPDQTNLTNNGTNGCYTYTLYTQYNQAPCSTGCSTTITVCVLEAVAPLDPTFVKTPNLNTTVRRIRTDDTVIRLSVSDTVLLLVNASDDTTYKSGLDAIQFSNGTYTWTETTVDGQQYIDVDDGSHNVAAKAIDGVGNVGSWTNVTITVTTIPKQIASTDYSSGKDHYTTSESISVSVNFTSDQNTFSSSNQCTVYAYNSTSKVILASFTGTTSGDNLYCSSSISLSSLSDKTAYRIGVNVTDNNGEQAYSGEAPWRDSTYTNPVIWMCDYVYNSATGEYVCQTPCDGVKPTTPELYYPDNNTEVTLRSPTFVWYNSTTSAGTLTYELMLTLSSDPLFQNVVQYYTGISEGGYDDNKTSYTIPDQLSSDSIYIWKIRSTDSTVYSNWSGTWQFNLSSAISLSFINNTLNFGELLHSNLTENITENTTDDSPRPFVIQNDGNVFVNVSVTSTRLWDVQDLNTVYFQFAIDDNETSSYTSATTTYTNLNYTRDIADIVSLNWTNATDSAEIELSIIVPLYEPPGVKNSTITITGTYASD